MTERELMSIIYIQAQIDKINNRIAELEDEDGLGSVNMDGMPHGSTPGNPVERMAMARAALHEKLMNLRADKLEKELEIREYIDTVDEYDVQLIMEWRYIDLMDWHDIALEWEDVSGQRLDRTTLAKRLQKYLQKRRENPHFSHSSRGVVDII